VAAELEPGQAVAVPVQGRPRAHQVGPLGTKSVTAAPRRGLVPLLAAEDLVAAVVETMREPAAAEAVVAWVEAE
jgi:hypothetical protein